MLCTPGLLNIIPEAIIRRNTENLPNSPVLDQVSDLDTQREVSRPDSLHKKQVLLLGCLAQDLRLLRVHRKRLLAEHILARLKRKHHVLVVVRVRRRNVQHVDIGICHQLLVVSVGSTWAWNA